MSGLALGGQRKTSSGAVTASDGPSPSLPPPTIWCACQTSGGADMSAPATCALVGRWHIVEADIWDREYLDLCGPAMMSIGADEIAFVPCRPASNSAAAARWFSSHGPGRRMDEVSGDAMPNSSMTAPSKSPFA